MNHIPWIVDVGRNPNILREAPPPPLGAAPAGGYFMVPQAAAPPPAVMPGVIVGAAPPVVFAEPPAIAPPPPYFGYPPDGGWGVPPPPPMLAGAPPDYAPFPPPQPAPIYAAPAPVAIGAPAPPPPVYAAPVPGAAAPAGPENDPSVFPGGRDPNVSILFDNEYCTFNQILGPQPPWLGIGELDYTARMVSSNWTAEQLIKALLHYNQEPLGWAVSECIERGNGRWEKGTTFVYGAEVSRLPLRMAGWTGRRGRDMGVVWCYLHRA